MKVAIASSGRDLQAAIDSRFGRCPHFVIVDTDSMAFVAVDNIAAAQGSGAGIAGCQLVATEKDNDANAVCYDGLDTTQRILYGVNTGYGWNGAWQVESPTNISMYRIVDGSLSYGSLVTKGRKAEGGYNYQGAGRSFDMVNAFLPWVSNMGVGTAP